MSGLAEQIKILYDQKLFSNIVSLANLTLAANDNSPDVLESPALKSQTLVIYGESLLHTGYFRKAEVILDKALILRKFILKPKGSGSHHIMTLGENEIMSDMDIKYMIHQCRANLMDGPGAIAALESIPAKTRNSRVNMALGKLYHSTGLERSAISAYKEVLRETPMALEAAEELLSLGVSGSEVGTLMLNVLCKLQGVDWLAIWLRAQAHLHSCSFGEALIALKQLNDRSALRGSSSLALTTGRTYYLQGDYKNALITLQRVYMLEPKLTAGMDLLASVLARERMVKELERLIIPLGPLLSAEAVPNRLHHSIGQPLSYGHGAEMWVALGYYALVRGHCKRANHLATKAFLMSSREGSVEALLLRGAALKQLKRSEAALGYYRDAIAICPVRYEAHEGLLDCYINLRRMREAISQAANSCKKLGQTPRALTLYANVVLKEPGLIVKAKSALEKALAQDSHYLPAVYLLADILEKEGLLEEAIMLLLRHVEWTPNSKLHTLIADLYSRTNSVEKSLNHYSTALNYDPKNRQAQEGLLKIDHAGSTPGAGGGGAGGGGKPSPCFLSTAGEDEGNEAGDTTLDMVADCLEDSDTEPEEPEHEVSAWPEIA